MITIPFAARLSSQGGSLGDGVIYGVLARVAPVSALSKVALLGSTRVLRGNADATGNLTWSNVTSAANDDTAGDVTVFDMANPTNDMLCFELATDDEVSGLALLLSTAASLTGTPVAEVRYRTTTGWATATGIVTPSLTSIGLKVVTFTAIRAADVALIDDPLDPFNAPQVKCLFLRFTGVTAVTTTALFTRAWKRRASISTAKAGNFTAMVNQSTNPDFSGYQNQIIPISGDVTAFGWNEIPARMNLSLYRPAAAALGARKWVYSKNDGTWADLLAANINDPTALFGALLALNPVAHQQINLTTTYAAGTWGNGGIASTETLAGDGYLEFKVGAAPSLALMAGFSTTNSNANYSSIQWAIHTGHAATAFCSFWQSGAQQGNNTFAIVAGDVIRLERRGDTFYAYQNGVLRHTFALKSTAAVLVDTAFIFLAGLTDFVLVNTAAIPEVPVVVTWKDNVAVTVANGNTQQFRIATERSIVLLPPSDWGKLSLTDTGDVAHNRYWLGWQHTADTTLPVLPFNATLNGQLLKDAGNSGIPAPETATYLTATIACRDMSSVASNLMLVNATQGKSISITVPANTAIVTATISFAVTKGDRLVITIPIGDAVSGIGDGVVFLS